jgi:hypothetical protein
VHETANDRHPNRPDPTRCALDTGDHRRLASHGLVCTAHHAQLSDMLDPAQTGQVFTKPGNAPPPAGIAASYEALDPTPVRRALDSQVASGAFGSTPPGRLDVMSLRDPRSAAADGAELWSVLGTLVGIALRLDLRDINGTPVPVPHDVHKACTWLHLRLDLLCAAEWIADAWHDLRTVHRQLRNAAGDAVSRPLGPCWKRVDEHGKLTDGGEWECGRPLFLPPQPLKGMDEPVVLPDDLRCSACGGHYDRAEIVRVGWQRRIQRDERKTA